MYKQSAKSSSSQHQSATEKNSLSFWNRYGLAYLLLVPALILLFGIVVGPALQAIWMSFHDIHLTSMEEPFIGLENYLEVLDSRLMSKVIRNSFVWTFGSVFLQFLIGFTLALVLDRFGKAGNYIRGFLLLSWVMPGIVIAFMWRFMLSPDWGIINAVLEGSGLVDKGIPWLSRGNTAMLSVIIANAWKGFPFWMIMISAGLKSINREIYDAAAVDGASGWRMIMYITVPLLRFPLFVTSTLAFIWTFNYFDLIFGMTGGGPLDATRSVPLYIYDTAFTGFRIGEASAASVLLMLFMSVVIVIYARALRIEGGQLS